MDHTTRTIIDRWEAIGYLPILRSIVSDSCVPFWWHGNQSDDGYGILHNGTICFIDTGERLIAVTARHVFEKYLKDKTSDPDIVCQIGSSTVDLQYRLIDQNEELDLATFEVSDVIVAATGARPFAPVRWPSGEVGTNEVLIYGGYPGSLRVEKEVEADLPFQWFAGPAISVTNGNIKLFLNLENFHQPLAGCEIENLDLGGMSGGPVFRFIPAPPIERLELVGFIYEFQESLELVYARPAHCVTANGKIDEDAAA